MGHVDTELIDTDLSANDPRPLGVPRENIGLEAIVAVIGHLRAQQRRGGARHILPVIIES